MKSKTVLAVLLAMVLVAVAVASAAAASPSQTIATDTPTATSTGTSGTGTPSPSTTPSPVPTTNPCAASGGTSMGGTPVSGGTTGGTGGTTSSEGDTSTGGSGGQPVATALCNFFGSQLNLTYQDIIGYHQMGFGFGEIAQACWMALVLNNGTTCLQILQDKQNHDFTNITLPNGQTPSNWGLLKKAVLGMHHGFNLGAVVSGRAVGLFNGTSFPGNGHGHGQGSGGPGNGQGQGGNNGQGGGPGNHGRP